MEQESAARIAALEREVAELRADLADRQAVTDLRRRLAQVGAVNALGAPTEHDTLLESIVGTATTVLRAKAGSLYLIDENTDELIFEVALGAQAASLRGRRMPIGQGIAGWVAATGQAIAISDVARDQRWAHDIGAAIGYVPNTMLVVPLMVRDEVIGVLQLLDKEGGETFNTADMQLLGLFAQQAAVAIAQSQRAQSVTGLVRALLAEHDGQRSSAAIITFAERVEGSAEYRDLLRLADLLGRIARHGDTARYLSLDIAGAIANYLDAPRRSI